MLETKRTQVFRCDYSDRLDEATEQSDNQK